MAAQPMSSGQGHYYLSLAAVDDYYLKPGEEPPGRWLGEGAEALGFTGIVTSTPFLNLLEGFSSDRSIKLVQNAGQENHRAGWEGVFSAPKSVSVLWGVCRDEAVRQAIEEAQAAAVRVGVSYLEKTAGYTRVGHAGETHERSKLVVAAFPHTVSRAQDPDIHTHCIFANAGVRENGRTAAIESRRIYEHKMAAGALYRAELAAQLEQRLGVDIERVKSWFEIKDMSRPLCKELSKRRNEIEEALEHRGVSTGKAGDIAALETRTKKEAVARNVLYGRWEEAAERHSVTQSTVASLLFRPKDDRSIDIEGREALIEALTEVTRQKSSFTERELVQYVAQAAQARGIGSNAVLSLVSEYTAGRTFGISPHAVLPLGLDKVGDQRYTTAEVWTAEKELLGIVDRSRHNHSHDLRAGTLRGVLLEQKLLSAVPLSSTRDLNPEQKEALRHVTRGSGSVSVISGMAGTGKTTLLNAARRAFEKEGYSVMGVCVAAKAARGLEEGSGINSRTVASFLAALNRWENREAFSGDSIMPKVLATWKHATWQVDGKTAKKIAGEYYKPTSELKHNFLFATGQISRGHKNYLNMKLQQKENPPFKLTKKTIIFVDEAGMIATPDLHKISSAAEKYGCKVVLVGDNKQLQAIGCGAPLKYIADKIGCAVLKVIQRQKGPDAAWQIPAIHDFSEGRALRALQAYDERGYLTTKETRREARLALIDEWKKEGIKRPEENVIFCGERVDVRALNSLAQAERLRAGVLKESLTAVNGQTVHRRDRILITENAYKYGIRNGDLGTVHGKSSVDGSLIVKLDTGDKVRIPREFKQFQHGYAITTHKGQGETVTNAYVLAGGSLQGAEITYVQASRAVKKTHFFSDEATLELAREMSRPRQNPIAHELVERRQKPVQSL